VNIKSRLTKQFGDGEFVGNVLLHQRQRVDILAQIKERAADLMPGCKLLGTADTLLRVGAGNEAGRQF